MDQMKGTEQREIFDLNNCRNGTQTGNSGEEASLGDDIKN